MTKFKFLDKVWVTEPNFCNFYNDGKMMEGIVFDFNDRVTVIDYKVLVPIKNIKTVEIIMNKKNLKKRNKEKPIDTGEPK